jgi:FtsH-binding integral membrane protein
MVDYTNRNNRSLAGAESGYIDLGLRAHMLKVYNHMFVGIGISGLVAFLALSVPAISAIVFAPGAQIIFTIALLGMVFLLVPKMPTMSEGGARLSFYAYAVVLSLAISPVFYVYTNESIARVFFITSAVFLSMSLYGYTTKKDLTSIGTFAIIGIWGVFFASIVNIFLKSDGMSFITSIVAVVASLGLTAWDTQKIKQIYYAVGSSNQSALNKAAIMGALQLYFDFVYMFIHLLSLLGDRRG